jgi:hypothetical protein
VDGARVDVGEVSIFSPPTHPIAVLFSHPTTFISVVIYSEILCVTTREQYDIILLSDPSSVKCS